MLRAMETAHFMTFSDYSKKTVYAFPHLKETYKNIYSKQMDDKYFPLKSIREQETYLKEEDIYGYPGTKTKRISHKYVNNSLRTEPGNIEVFFKWFIENIDLKYMSKIKNKNELNVLIITHSGVMKNFTKVGFKNNDGFEVSTIYDTEKKSLSFNKNHIIFININNYNLDLNCPTSRCSDVCENIS